MAPLTLAFPDAPAAPARRLAATLAPCSWADDAYLAGSAALALYLGHRPVHSLDLMCATNRLAGPDRRDLLEELLALEPAARVETARDGYLYVGMGETALRLFYYPYPLIDPLEEWVGMGVASAADLGLMKLGAIISRGSRRDLVDLYLLCQRLPLPTLLQRSPEKYGHVRDFPLQALKGLADRSLAAEEPMPRLTRPLGWEEVEAWLDRQVARLGREHAGLEPLPGGDER